MFDKRSHILLLSLVFKDNNFYYFFSTKILMTVHF